MAAAAIAPDESTSWRGAVAYMWSVSAVGLTLGVAGLSQAPAPDAAEMLPWLVAALAGDALAVRLSGTVALSASLPVTLAAAFVLPVPAVTLVAFFSVWQLPGTTWVRFGRNLFNRVEVAVAATCAALVVEAFGAPASKWPMVLVVSVAALVADALANAALMTPVVCLGEHRSVRSAMTGLLGLRPAVTLAAYGSAALAAPILVSAWTIAGVWGLAASMVCVGLAGMALRSAQQLGTAEVALSSTRALLQEGSAEAVRERREERRRLAGELHDEVLPALFKVHLMGEVVKRDLDAGRLLDLEEDVRGLLASTSLAQGSVRTVVGSLRESPIGIRGLRSALTSLAEGLETAGSRIEVDVTEVNADEQSQTVAYQVVREAVTNAAKYSRAALIAVTVKQEAGGNLIVAVSDDGCGFDVSSLGAEVDHYGLTLMKERVEAVGGSFLIDSRLGGGTLLWAAIPIATDSTGG
jgi:signal transduction histidine kinase